MKTISRLFLLLSVLITSLSILAGHYHALVLALMAFVMHILTKPEKKVEPPYRDNKTWSDDVR